MFNRAWFLDEDFTKMVKEEWPRLLPGDHMDEMDSLSQKLRLMKTKVKVWTRCKSSEMKKDFIALDSEIKNLLSSSVSGILTLED